MFKNNKNQIKNCIKYIKKAVGKDEMIELPLTTA